MFIDSHCHFNFEHFKVNRKLLMFALNNAHINKLIIPGTDAQRWPEIIKLTKQYEGLYFALGLHPHFLTDFEPQQLIQLEHLLTKTRQQSGSKCVALGEIGLDKLIDSDLALQESVFLAQLAIAQSLKLPVILHVVKTQSRVLELLKQVNFSYGGVYHAFSGSAEVAKEFIKLGFKLGIGGVITYPRAKKTRSALQQLPLSSLILETDAPDMPVYQQIATNNSPANLPIIFNALCELREESASVLEHQLYNNTLSIFSIDDD